MPAPPLHQAGNWFTFVAAFAVIQQLSPAASASTHIALFLVCRRLPYLLLFPLSGLAADRLDRGLLLLACCLVEGAVSFSLPLVVLHRRLEWVGAGCLTPDDMHGRLGTCHISSAHEPAYALLHHAWLPLPQS